MTTPEQNRLAALFRKQLLGVRAQTISDFTKLWPMFSGEDTAQYAAWLTAARTLTQRDRAVAAGAGAAYARASRAIAGVGGTPVIRTSASAPVAQVDTSLTVTSLVAYRRARRAGKTVELANQIAMVDATGSMTKLVVAGANDTIRDSVAADPQGVGWARVASPGACDFCLMLSDRGAVYSADSVDFAAHDHCMCTCQPIYGETTKTVRTYTPSARNISDKQRADLRAYLADHYGEAMPAAA